MAREEDGRQGGGPISRLSSASTFLEKPEPGKSVSSARRQRRGLHNFGRGSGGNPSLPGLASPAPRGPTDSPSPPPPGTARPRSPGSCRCRRTSHHLLGDTDPPVTARPKVWNRRRHFPRGPGARGPRSSPGARDPEACPRHRPFLAPGKAASVP